MNRIQNASTQRLLLVCGIIGPLLFNLTYLVDGVTRPGYDGWREAISALSLGDRGWLQIANFIVFGVLMTGFAFGLRLTLTTGVTALLGWTLQILVGLGLIVAGIFSQDPTEGYPPGAQFSTVSSTHATVHLLGAILSLAALAVWCFVIAARYIRKPGWRSWGVYALVTAILMQVFLPAFGVATAYHGPAGLFERLAVIPPSILVVLVAARLLSATRPRNQQTSYQPQP